MADKHVHDDKPEWLSEVQRLEVKPGDIVVIKYGMRLLPEATKRLHAYAKRWFPHNDVLILDDGVDIGVLTKQDWVWHSRRTKPHVPPRPAPKTV